MNQGGRKNANLFSDPPSSIVANCGVLDTIVRKFFLLTKIQRNSQLSAEYNIQVIVSGNSVF